MEQEENYTGGCGDRLIVAYGPRVGLPLLKIRMRWLFHIGRIHAPRRTSSLQGALSPPFSWCIEIRVSKSISLVCVVFGRFVLPNRPNDSNFSPSLVPTQLSLSDPSHRSLSVWFFLESFFLTASTITGRSPINTGWSHHLELKGRFFFYSRWCPNLKLIGQLWF